MRERLAPVDAEWRAVLTEAFAKPREELGIDMPLDALVAWWSHSTLESWSSVSPGSPPGIAELLDWIDQLLEERWQRR